MTAAAFRATKLKLTRGMPLAQRIAEHSMPVTESGCWLWLGALEQDGYGVIRFGGRQHKAHRVSFAAYRSAVPAGMKVLHQCDVRCCVNPDHLFLGTTLDNNRDRAKKGRSADRSGEKHPLARLTESNVREIRASSESQEALARRFGTIQQVISDIRRRKTWRHI